MTPTSTLRLIKVGHALACLLLIPFVSLAATSNEIARAIQDLGASDHKTREAASRLLSNSGAAAVSALELAARDSDPEIRLRAAELLPFARLGLPSELSPELRIHVSQYLRATNEGKHALVEKFAQAGPTARPVLIALALSERNFEKRIEIFESVVTPLMERLEQNIRMPAPSKEKLVAAMPDLEFYQAILPEDPQLPLAAVRRLDAVGLKVEANLVFERAFQQETRLCSEHPQDPEVYNNLAWLCAVARRRLDEGLKSIQRALELKPNDPPLMDTKAELLFQKGQRDTALDLINQCVKAAPDMAYFHEQQARIKTGDPTVPPPEADAP